MITAEVLADSYLRAIHERDSAAILKLFTDVAVVVHPILGTLQVAEFYEQLFTFAASDSTSLEHAFASVGTDGGVVLVFVDAWTTSDGSHYDSRMVLIFESGAEDRFRKLTVVFDTYGIR